MKRLLVAGACLLGSASAQEAAPEARAVQIIDDHLTPIAVGAEHELLHVWEGTWDVETKTWAGPRVITGRGRHTCRIMLGGLAIACEFAQMGDKAPLLGHSFTTWNTREGKYESYWFDTMSHGGMSHGWGTWDPVARTLTEALSGKDSKGQDYTIKTVTTFHSADRHVVTFYEVLADSKEHRTIEFVYNRRK